jgi:hypothetical protein
MHHRDQTNQTTQGRRLALASALGLAFAGLLSFAACGGGGKGNDSATASPAPASSTTVTIAGTLTGTSAAPQFNQQPVLASAATITLNGKPTTVTHLQPGVVLVGKATRDSHGFTLQSVDLLTELKGSIKSIDPVAATFKVLDTVVTVNALTKLEQDLPDHTFSSLTFADLVLGNFVSVFGTPQAGGGILATRVERETPGVAEASELRGVVSTLDSTAKTFLLGTHLVAFDSATVIGTLTEGARVEVEGSLSGTTFNASRIRVEDAMDHGEGNEVEAYGALSNLNATAKTFSLQSFKVDYSAATVEGTLAEGAMVEVDGALSATDPTVFLATKVEVRFPLMGNGASDREAEGIITALSATDLTLTVGGIIYWTDAQTLVMDRDAPIRFDQLSVGNRVEVRALSTHTNASGQPYASRVERKTSGG